MGRRVIINMAGRFVIGQHTYLDQMRAITMTLETLLSVDDDAQVRGVVYVFDCSGLSLRHGLVWSPTDAAKLLTTGQKYWPVRHRQVKEKGRGDVHSTHRYILVLTLFLFESVSFIFIKPIQST